MGCLSDSHTSHPIPALAALGGTFRGDFPSVVHDGKIVSPRAIRSLKNHAIVHVIDKLTGGGKKKNQRKMDQFKMTTVDPAHQRLT